MTITEILKGKITKAEDLPELMVMKSLRDFNAKVVTMPWWLRREWLRIEHEIYPAPTDVIESINAQIPQFALHVSAEDKTQICYTPDKAYGEADRQVRTTLARFLAKYYPQVSDDRIRDIQADHLASLNDDFEELTGEAICDTYRTLVKGTGGIGACMSNPDSYFPLKLNPTKVYDAPNISMAVLRNGKGEISARTMLYCPSETDKRFIRFWGDPKLQRKLERRGYKRGTWVGAEFKTIPLKGYDPDNPSRERGAEAYLVPYLDGNLGYGNDSHSTVAVLDGVLTCVSSAIAKRLSKHFTGESHLTALATTDKGCLWLRNIDTSALNSVCYLTGAAINGFTDNAYDYWNGTGLQKVCQEATKSLISLRVDSETVAYAPVGTSFFYSKWGDMIDTDLNRKAAGYVKLDPTYYPDDQGWKRTVEVKHVNDDRYILAADAVYIYEAEAWSYDHASVIDKSYTRLYPRDGIKSYASAGEKILRTTSGRKVVSRGYDVKVCYDGSVDFDRNVHSTTMLGNQVYYVKGTPKPSVGDGHFDDYLTKQLEYYSEYGLEYLLVNHINNIAPNRNLIRGQYQYRLDLRDVRLAHFKELPHLLGNFQVAKTIRWFALYMAEANALDYNLPDTPQVDYSVVVPPLDPSEYKSQRLILEQKKFDEELKKQRAINTTSALGGPYTPLSSMFSTSTSTLGGYPSTSTAYVIPVSATA